MAPLLERMKIADFEQRVGEKFTAKAADGRKLTLTLTSVDALPSPRRGRRKAFSLEFRDTAQDHVPQQTLAVKNAKMGSFELFVVPLGPSPDGMRYEAIFT
jgi:hypothetical protein